MKPLHYNSLELIAPIIELGLGPANIIQHHILYENSKCIYYDSFKLTLKCIPGTSVNSVLNLLSQ